MLLDFLLQLGEWLIDFIALVLPDYADYPFPEWFTVNLVSYWASVKTVLALPLIRVVFEWFYTWWIPIIMIFFLKNIIIKTISAIPGFNGVRNLK